MSAPPPPEVLDAFGVAGPAVLLEGGQGEAYAAGGLVLKPAGDPEEHSWVADLVESLRTSGLEGFDLVEPVRARDGAWAAGGWGASVRVPGEPQPECGSARLLEACDRLSAALATAPLPPFLDTRSHRWAVGDRVAWGEVAVPAECKVDPLVVRLVPLMRAIDLPNQVVHGDVRGNVLFDTTRPPTVIDLSLYWRPAAYARAVVVVDGLLWYGADPAEARSEAVLTYGAQLLVRALLFRLVVDVLSRRERQDPSVPPEHYSAVVDLVESLAAT